MRHTWTADWKPCREEDMKHISVLTLKHALSICDFPIPALDLHVSAQQIGPGLVYLKWHSIFGRGVFIQSLTPVEPLLQVGGGFCFVCFALV